MAAVQVHHPLFARMYARLGAALEAKGAAEYRDEALRGLRGRVLEIGAGTGLNFRHYPTTVSEVIALEPESYLRARAEVAAEEAGVTVRVLDGVAEDLPLDTASFDAAVASLVLCSVRDPDRCLAELRRVVRPGGELRVFEHVRSSSPSLARAQRALDVVWPLLGGGCHTSRDTASAVERAGFVIEERREFTFRPSVLMAPTSPHLLARAHRPELAAA